MGELAVSPFLRFADSFSLSLWRQLLYPAQIGVGFGCLPDAPFALLAFVQCDQRLIDFN
jgi:hypothetical protein